jgi:very-short-patch-repair endonuclease
LWDTFVVRVSNPGAVLRAKGLRRASTKAEEMLWDHLRDRRFLGLKFRRQAPVGPYVADFLCHEMRLVLELDGGIHTEERQLRHDVNRDANLQALGYRVLRFTNDQVQNELAALLDTLSRLYHDRNSS